MIEEMTRTSLVVISKAKGHIAHHINLFKENIIVDTLQTTLTVTQPEGGKIIIDYGGIGNITCSLEMLSGNLILGVK